MALLIGACALPGEPTATALPPVTPTLSAGGTPSALPTVTAASRPPSPTVAVTVPSATAIASPTLPATPVPPATALPPTATPADQAGGEILLPLLIHSEAGRIYASIRATDGQRQVAVFSAQSGQVQAGYPFSGSLGLDAGRAWLYVDQGQAGLAVVEALTGRLQRTISIPPAGEMQAIPPPPQADPAAGRVLVMRGNTVYVVDPAQGQVERSLAFDLRPQDNCRIPHDASLPIEGSRYDAEKRILYLDFVSYVCTPWIGYTIVSYDVARGAEISKGAAYPFVATAAGGSLYGSSWHRFGIGYLWAWRDGRPGLETADWGGGLASVVPDSRRRRLYQAAGGGLRVLDAASLRLLFVAPIPAPGSLADYDAQTDQLYFVDGARLLPRPAGAIRPPAAVAYADASPPPRPIRALAVSPAWSQDKTLFGLWSAPQDAYACYAFNQGGGALYASRDGGNTWQQSLGGLPPGCPYLSALDLSPRYNQDRTLFAGVEGTGLFRSTDGGLLWQPAGAGLPSMGVQQVVVSPGFAADRTLFARLLTGGLQRSTNAGDTWATLPITPSLVALSPEFGTDHTLAAAVPMSGGVALSLSRDGGEQWSALTAPPQPPYADVRMLSLAPAFAKWGVMFTYGGDGRLYRSGDGGQAWQAVLATGVANPQSGQILYGPQETNRPVFFLALGSGDGLTPEGRLFRSRDGGQTWQRIETAPGPTALAISPDFADDELIFVGGADGRVLTVQGLALPGSSP